MGLSRHKNATGRCRLEDFKKRNQLACELRRKVKKRTRNQRRRHRRRSTSEAPSNAASEPEPSRTQQGPDLQLTLGDEQSEADDPAPNEGANIGAEVIDLTSDNGDASDAEGAGRIAVEGMDVEQDCKYIPHQPPDPPEPFDSAAHVENHPSPTAGGVLRWVVNVEAPSPYAIILDERDMFEIAYWLANQPLTDAGRNAFLRMTRNQDLPWRNVHQFYESIDNLPHGPGWYRRKILVKGDRGNLTLEVWLRNSLHVVRQLIGNPRFRQYMRFSPVRNWTSALRQTRIYSEMWTGDWWWETQNLLGDGATICPVIIASDKTQLTQLAGGKQAWPVYLMIGNISKKIRRRPGECASLLVGYIPADNLESCISNEDHRRIARWKVFHKAMEMILEPIKNKSRSGEEMVCADGGVRRVHPILAAYMGDLPEQWLVTCTQQDRCPTCMVPYDLKANGDVRYPRRSRRQTLDALEDYKYGHRGTIKSLGIREITDPFWATMPFTDIFAAMAPDLLHQLDKGVFGEYLVDWGQHILGEGEFDRRLKGMPRFQGLRHFDHGIAPIPDNQWTGNEARALGRVYLPLVTGSGYPDFTRAARAIVDFQFRMRQPEATDIDIADAKHDLRVFHEAKEVFLDSGARDRELGFAGLTKLHVLEHYFEWIRRMGTLDGYSTDISERLHIDCVKNPWRATNHVHATEQMTTRLQRAEIWAIACARMYEAGRLPESLRGEYELRSRVEYLPKSNGNVEPEDDVEVEGIDVEIEGVDVRNYGAWTLGQIWHPAPTIYLAKTPPLHGRKVSGTYLVDVHGAVGIVQATREFLGALNPAYRRVPLDGNSDFRVWTRFRLHHQRPPFLQSLPPRIDRIRAFPPEYDEHDELIRQGYMDTVLYLADPECQGLGRYRAGRVRAIFRLPRHLSSIYDGPLVYLETFKPFSMPVNYPDHRLCTTGPQIVNGACVGIAVPLTKVRAACHLAPQFHRMDDADDPQPLTSADDLLSTTNHFYLSRHNSDFMFALLDHWRRAEVETA